MWTLEEALVLIREMQPSLHRQGYHVTLGGGVLNAGSSNKDLDLYFFSVEQNMSPMEELLQMLENRWGVSKPISVLEDHYPDDPSIRRKVKFMDRGKRIDAFLV